MTSSPKSQSLSQIGQIAVVVHDLQKAVSFYRDTLGLKYMFEAPSMAFFDCAGIRLMLGLPSQADLDHAASIIYFKVDNIQSTADLFMSRGVHFDAKPHLVAQLPGYDLWMAFFRDMEKNVVALMSEVRH